MSSEASPALLCATAFLVAADQGIYVMAALLVTFAAVAIDTRRTTNLRQNILAGDVCSSWRGSAVLVVVINTIFARPFDFRFWRDSFTQVSAYRWATPFHMSPTGAAHLFGTLIAGAAIFLLRATLGRSGHSAIVQRTGFLLSGFAFALVMMQSGLVRADNGHIVSACFAMVFLAGAILFSFESPNVSMAAVLVALLVFGLFRRGGISALEPHSALRRVAKSFDRMS